MAPYRRYIDDALQYAGGTHTYDDVVVACLKGDLQPWFGPHSIIITEVIVSPRLRLLNYFIAAGNLQELEVMYAPVEEWGRQQGCTVATFTGRPGWQRSFLTQRLGWKPSGLVVFEKALGEQALPEVRSE